jgi:hypothetical protein
MMALMPKANSFQERIQHSPPDATTMMLKMLEQEIHQITR